MASNFNGSTPAATAGNKNVTWQTDGSGNDSAQFDSRFGFPVFNAGVGSNAQVLYLGIVPFASTFPASASLSPNGIAGTAATASTTFTIKKNGSPVATIAFTSTTGTWTQASSVSFNGTSDTIEIDGPATADATLANFGFSWIGYKT